MPGFSQRVEIVLSPEQLRVLEATAESQGVSLDVLISRAIDAVYLKPDRARRLEAVRRLAALNLPVADWEQMERESTR